MPQVLVLLSLLLLSGCGGGPRTIISTDGSSYIELSLYDSVSIISATGQERSYPTHSISISSNETLLAALQKLYPDYWFSELADLPEGNYDVVIIPAVGAVLNQAQQQQELRRAYETSFKLRIQVNDEDKVVIIKGRIL